MYVIPKNDGSEYCKKDCNCSGCNIWKTILRVGCSICKESFKSGQNYCYTVKHGNSPIHEKCISKEENNENNIPSKHKKQTELAVACSGRERRSPNKRKRPPKAEWSSTRDQEVESSGESSDTGPNDRPDNRSTNNLGFFL